MSGKSWRISKSSPRSPCTNPNSIPTLYINGDSWVYDPGEEITFVYQLGCIQMQINRVITESGLNNRIFSFLNIQRNMVLGWFRHMSVSAGILSHFTLLSSTCWLLTLALSPQGHKMVFKSSRKPSKHRKEIEQVRILSLSHYYIYFLKVGQFFTDVAQVYPYVSLART